MILYEDNRLDYVKRIANYFFANPNFVKTEDGECKPLESFIPWGFLFALEENREYWRERNKECEILRFPFTKKEYMDNESIIDTLKAYDIDLEKFWYAMQFSYFFTDTFMVNSRQFYKSPYQELSELLTLFSGINSDNGKRNEIVVTKDGKKQQTIKSPSTFKFLAEAIDDLLQKDPQGLHTSQLDGDSAVLESASVQIWHTTVLLRWLLDDLQLPLKRSRNSKVGESTDSFSKMLLLSRITYFMRYTNNNSYVGSAEDLKQLMKRYKDKEIESFPMSFIRNMGGTKWEVVCSPSDSMGRVILCLENGNNATKQFLTTKL